MRLQAQIKLTLQSKQHSLQSVVEIWSMDSFFEDKEQCVECLGLTLLEVHVHSGWNIQAENMKHFSNCKYTK